MAEQKKEEFLDEIEESELDHDELIDIDAEAAELEKLDEVTAERDDYRDKFMRALADAENARKRADKDRKEAENYGGSKLARDLLPIYDNMKRAVDSITIDQKETVGSVIEGVELTMRELLNVFSKHGISPLAMSHGLAEDFQIVVRTFNHEESSKPPALTNRMFSRSSAPIARLIMGEPQV